MKLVLFPGMDGTGDLFAPFIASIPPHIETVVVRYPVDEQLTYSELTSLGREFLPINEPFLMLGESFSGPIAISLAAESPANLAGLILCCTFARNPHPRFRAFRSFTRLLPVKEIPALVSSFIVLGSESNEEQRDLFEMSLQRVDSKVLRHRIREIIDIDVSAALSQVNVRTQYIRATGDRLVPQAAFAHVKSILPDIELVELSGPHFLLQSHPDEVVVSIDEYFGLRAATQ